MLKFCFLSALLFLLQLLEAQEVSTLITQPGTQFEAITWGPNGNIYTLDFATGEVFKLDVEGNIQKLTVLAGALGGAVDQAGNFYCSELNTGRIIKFDTQDSASVYAEGLIGPAGILIDDENGIMYVANFSGNRISKIDMKSPNPTPETLTSGGLINGPDGLAFSPEGDIISANFNDNSIQKITPTGEVSQFAVIDSSPNSGYLVRSDDRYMVTGAYGPDIYAISLAGEVTKLAGTGAAGYQDGNLDLAQFSFPNGIAVSPSGDSLLITESGAEGRIRLITGLNVISSTKNSIRINQLKISPNPVSTNLNIAFEMLEEDTLVIQLVDLQGRLIQTLTRENASPGVFNKSYNIGKQLVPGVYVLNFVVGAQSLQRKIAFR